MKVSVIVPICNVEKYLKRCVDSLLYQTYKDIEILLIDDGSTDGSGVIADSYANDERVIVKHKENGGLSDARNYGIEFATGDSILFVDSDDWLNNDAIEKMVNAMQEHDAELVMSSYVIDYINEGYSIQIGFKENKVFQKDEIQKAILEMEKISLNVVWVKLYNSRIIKKNNIRFMKDGMPGEDLLFNCDYLMCKPLCIAVIKDCTYHYMRQDEDSLAGRYRGNLYQQVLRFNKKRQELYRFFNMNEIEYQNMYAHTYVSYIFSCIPNLYKKAGGLNRKQRKYQLREILFTQDLGIYLKLVENKDRNLKLLNVLYKSRKTFLPVCITDVLFFIRYKFEKFYKQKRKKLMRREGAKIEK